MAGNGSQVLGVRARNRQEIGVRVEFHSLPHTWEKFQSDPYFRPLFPSQAPSERLHELVRRNAGLLDDARECADLELAMQRHHATSRTAAQDHVAAFLTQGNEAKFFQRTNSLRT